MDRTRRIGPRIRDAEAIYILDVTDRPEAAGRLHEQLDEWDRFEIVADVTVADLVFAIDVVDEDPAGANGDGTPSPGTPGRANGPGRGSSPSPVEERAVMLVVDPGSRTVLWQDSEAFGHGLETAEKLVGRFRERLADGTRPTPAEPATTAPPSDAGADEPAKRKRERATVPARAPRPERPHPADVHDFDVGRAGLDPPRLEGESVSRLMLPPGVVASVTCLVREDGTVANAMVREVGPPTLTSGQVGDIVGLLVSQAMNKWRFEPGRRRDEPAAGWVTVDLAWE